MPKVSVIIPVYNVEKYLRACLDSVTGQSLKDMEIICVNDGSTDRSGKILKKYAFKDGRIIVIDQPNGGISRARNAGLDFASGDYIYFLDSDDLILPNAMKLLYNRAERDNLEMLFFDAESFADEVAEGSNTATHYRDYYIRRKNYPGEYTGIELMSVMFRNHEYRQSPCLQFLKRSFVEKYHLRFLEDVYHEDNLFTFQGLLKAENVGYQHSALYRRRVRPGSVVTLAISGEHVYGYYRNYVGMCQALAESPDYDNPVLWDIIDDVLHNMRFEFSHMDRLKYKLPEMSVLEYQDFKAKVIDYVDKPSQGPIKRFFYCLRDNGLKYTIRHAAFRILSKIAPKKKKRRRR